MKEPGRGEVAQLWLVLLPRPLELNAAATATGLEPALVAKLATQPEAAEFIAQAVVGEELQLRARQGWLLERLRGKMRLRKHEWNLLEQRLRHQLGPHVEHHWSEEGTVTRDLDLRPASRSGSASTSRKVVLTCQRSHHKRPAHRSRREASWSSTAAGWSCSRGCRSASCAH